MFVGHECQNSVYVHYMFVYRGVEERLPARFEMVVDFICTYNSIIQQTFTAS